MSAPTRAGRAFDPVDELRIGADMEEALERAAERIRVLPWGNWNAGARGDAESVRREFGVPADARVLLTLSRISPEKGQDLLLEALLEWEAREDFPGRPLWLFVCGDAAFMQGRMKVTGNMGKLMQLMPLTNSPEYKELQEQVRELTEY